MRGVHTTVHTTGMLLLSMPHGTRLAARPSGLALTYLRTILAYVLTGWLTDEDELHDNVVVRPPAPEEIGV